MALLEQIMVKEIERWGQGSSIDQPPRQCSRHCLAEASEAVASAQK